MQLHPVPGQERVVFLKPLVTDPRIEVGEYTYYDDPDDPLAFEHDAFLYAHGPERLVIGRYCAIASKVRFLMSVTEHARTIMAGEPAELERIAADVERPGR